MIRSPLALSFFLAVGVTTPAYGEPQTSEAEYFAKGLRHHLEMVAAMELMAKPITVRVATVNHPKHGDKLSIGVFDLDECHALVPPRPMNSALQAQYDVAIAKAIEKNDIAMIGHMENKRIEIPFLDRAFLEGEISRQFHKAPLPTQIVVSRQAIFYVREEAGIQFVDVQPILDFTDVKARRPP